MREVPTSVSALLRQPGPVLVGQNQDNVLMHFERPITWVRLSPQEALEVGLSLVSAAAAAGVVAPTQQRLL